jgi:hypothetical protein
MSYSVQSSEELQQKLAARDEARSPQQPADKKAQRRYVLKTFAQQEASYWNSLFNWDINAARVLAKRVLLDCNDHETAALIDVEKEV